LVLTIDEDVIKTLEECRNRKLENKDGILLLPTLLFSKKIMVKEYNDKKLDELIKKNTQSFGYNSEYIFGPRVKVC
jgi:hypothetical protein|tara:strand:+ start:514 stop:741 length:228 start_codon:yes stop_codon:yes gene_type:complete